MDKTDIVIEVCGVGLAREELLRTKINQHPELAEWFEKNFNIIKVTPTLKEMCSPLGCVYGEWKKDLLDVKISKRDIGKSIFELIKDKKNIRPKKSINTKLGIPKDVLEDDGTHTNRIPLAEADNKFLCDKYSDKYFVRSREILEKECLNPIVEMQVFIRRGPGVVKGLDEAVEYIKDNSDIEKAGGEIHTLGEGSIYDANEIVMRIIAPIQSIIALETQYLGIISALTTKATDGGVLFPDAITENVKKVVDLVDGRPVFYFGARHAHYKNDRRISKAAFDGGVTGCSTDAGAETVGKKGMGTIPHALVIAFASKYGIEEATMKATEAFDKHMPKEINRIALVDTFNREITDSIMTAKKLGKRLFGVRIDTCGENLGEGCSNDDVELGNEVISGVKGVTKELAYAVRSALDKNGFKNVKIILSSGFAKAEKVMDFVATEKRTGIKLFDGLGCGQFFHSRTATADIVKVDGRLLSKTGRGYKENKRLIRRL